MLFSTTMRLLGPVSKALSGRAPGPFCWRLDRILGKRTLEDWSLLLLGNRASHGDNTEHQEYQTQKTPHLKSQYNGGDVR